MTTIAYHHESGIVAVDSRRSAGGTITTDNHDKIVSFPNGMKIIGSGDNYSIAQLSKLYAGEIESLSGSIEYEKTVLLVVHKGKVARVGYDEGEGFWTEIIGFDIAMGSGGPFALAAMDFGKGAEEAVNYAMTRDIYTGGKVKTIDINDESVDT